MRINTPGGVEILPVPVKAWVYATDGTDIAVARLGMLNEAWGKRVIPHQMYANQLEVAHVSWQGGGMSGWIGPGDECFFLGRFSTHEGTSQNRPSARFGVLAMTHGETIRDERSGLEQESFLVEARSLSGFSGSPVFAYKSAIMDAESGEVKPLISSRVCFLGIDWCHLSKYEQVLTSDRKTPAEPKQWVLINTGMAGVIPAWKLAELLNEPVLLNARTEAARLQMESALQEQDGVAALDAGSTEGTSEYERFEDLTRKLVQMPEPESGATSKTSLRARTGS
jgi:hypothetical protein